MKIITWNRSFKGLHNGDEGQDDFESDEWETLATVLDKMLAWEKKLYDEVKVILSFGTFAKKAPALCVNRGKAPTLLQFAKEPLYSLVLD